MAGEVSCTTTRQVRINIHESRIRMNQNHPWITGEDDENNSKQNTSACAMRVPLPPICDAILPCCRTFPQWTALM